MFEVQDFFRMEGTYSFRYAELSIPDTLYKEAGLVTKNIPGKPPFVDGRNWLKVPPTWRRRGLIYEITEQYWLSGIGGWPVPIYGDGAGTNQPDSSESFGLVTGNLPTGSSLR